MPAVTKTNKTAEVTPKEKVLSLAEIAEDIAYKYLFRPYATYTEDQSDLLDYADLRAQAVDYGLLQRPLYGFQHACRLAALVPHLVKFYRDHQHCYSFRLREEMKVFFKLSEKKQAQYIRGIQITALLRSVGRINEGRKRKVQYRQSAIECFAYLSNLGYNQEQANCLSQSISLCEVPNKIDLDLASCVLSDAEQIESMRLVTNERIVYLQDFAFYQNIGLEQRARAPGSKEAPIMDIVSEFETLIEKHAAVIIAHQGCLLNYIHDLGLVAPNITPVAPEYVTSFATYKARQSEFHVQQVCAEYGKTYADIAAQVNRAQTQDAGNLFSPAKEEAVSFLANYIESMLKENLNKFKVKNIFQSSRNFKIEALRDLLLMLQEANTGDVNHVVFKWRGKTREHRGSKGNNWSMMSFHRNKFVYRWQQGKTATEKFFDDFLEKYGTVSLQPQLVSGVTPGVVRL